VGIGHGDGLREGTDATWNEDTVLRAMSASCKAPISVELRLYLFLAHCDHNANDSSADTNDHVAPLNPLKKTTHYREDGQTNHHGRAIEEFPRIFFSIDQLNC
jgi:hypothetical protein